MIEDQEIPEDHPIYDDYNDFYSEDEDDVGNYDIFFNDWEGR